MKVEFVGVSEGFDIYSVGGSHLFEMPTDSSPGDLSRLSEVFNVWSKFVKEVATIDG